MSHGFSLLLEMGQFGTLLSSVIAKELSLDEMVVELSK